MLKIKFVFFVIFSFLSINCVASNHIRPEYFSKLLGVELGKQNLYDIQKMYGKAKIAKMGDAATSKSYICYTLTQNNIEQVVLFSSNSELAGNPDYVVTQIEIYQVDNNPFKNIICNAMVNGSSDVNSLVGRSKQEFSKNFNFTSKDITDSFNYSFCYKVNMQKEEPTYNYWKERTDCFDPTTAPYYDICINVEAGFKKGVLFNVVLSLSESVC